MDRILEDVDYHSFIDDGTDEGHDRWDNVLELRRLAAEYQEQGLEAFLERVALVSDQDTLEDNAGVPTLLTLHAAKGLEFPVVFITGLNDGTLPHSRSFDDPEAMLEERRLFYVGITRARDHLVLVYAQNRSAFGYTEPVDPSRYLDDIPLALIYEEQSGPSRKRPMKEAAYHPERWSTPDDFTHTRRKSTANITRSQAPDQLTYSAGMHVQHPTWGEGMVLNSRIQDGDEIVDIFFKDVGLKRVAASLARLEIKV
jgi:DNA helicase-2/ATP-dependent DNA helicase PcrA